MPATRVSPSRSVSASPDSGSPNIRIVYCRYDARPVTAAAKASVSVAVSHIACSSLGGPGSTITVGVPAITRPGAVPTGSSTVAPTGTRACLRLAARTASKSTLSKRAIIGLRICAIRSSSASSSTRSRPQNWATVATVRSSAVGPSPPLVRIRSIPCSARNCKLAQHVLGTVGADRDVCEFDAHLEQPVGEPRPIAVLHPPGQDLGSGDDDARARAHRPDTTRPHSHDTPRNGVPRAVSMEALRAREWLWRL